jgi:TrmH family RNA methyltransferase
VAEGTILAPPPCSISAPCPAEITAFSNPLVKRARGLREKRHRREEGLFLAEGLRILTEAREAGRLPEYLFFRATAPIIRWCGAVDATEAAGGEAIETNADILAKLSGKDNPAAVVGVYPEFADRSTRSTAPRADLAGRRALRDPGNLGTILRTGDAVGAGGLILVDDCVDPFSVEAVRATHGALFTVPVARARWDEFRAWLRAGPGQLVGPSLERDTTIAAALRSPTFLLTGNEAQGMPAVCGRMRPAGQDPDARQGRQPQRRGGDRGDGL